MQIELETSEKTRIQRLKSLTDATHDRLDKRIMAAQPFASRERYALFLQVQHHFHADVDPLYLDPRLNALLPKLEDRARLDALRQDLMDVTGETPPVLRSTAGALEIPAALGWLYVAEGSNLGAAFLLKEAAKLGLTADFGARHLAPHPAGRGLHWREFVADFNALDLSEADEAKMADGAKAAFLRVHQLVDQIFG
ncbi:biliverdin-producing heme oxygenase [Neorhizobium sp. SOG26]|uniref:biliverdin-producing heme oxygenase n=1 Tax=Neorhizobium sp. SOG26 TaxID=2060726 RepID=UPI000E587453|nr:biliverdin-producing heme oxygenase [Neorhizobium sp. SOG26]AXV16691.1 biliverdin-producing heme oxygenase [Neorhizobium sp. SOG26]